MLKHWNTPWRDVPIVVIDTETTGIRPGIDRAVQVALVRFEKAQVVACYACVVNPEIAIPEESTKIHGIKQADVEGQPAIDAVFRDPDVIAILDGAQPAAYNAPFDRCFVPPFGEDWANWPWLDPLVWVRFVDRYEKGTGRHRLEAACARHGVKLTGAHDAQNDARAAGHLMYAIFEKTLLPPDITLGRLLKWQRDRETEEWMRFNDWKANNAK